MSHTRPGTSYICMYTYMCKLIAIVTSVNTSPVISNAVCYRIDIMYTMKYLNIYMYYLICYSRSVANI